MKKEPSRAELAGVRQHQSVHQAAASLGQLLQVEVTRLQHYYSHPPPGRRGGERVGNIKTAAVVTAVMAGLQLFFTRQFRSCCKLPQLPREGQSTWRAWQAAGGSEAPLYRWLAAAHSKAGLQC